MNPQHFRKGLSLNSVDSIMEAEENMYWDFVQKPWTWENYNEYLFTLFTYSLMKQFILKFIKPYLDVDTHML